MESSRPDPDASHAELVAELAATRDALRRQDARVEDLEHRLAESHEQQAAAAAILQVISRSSPDAGPVFDAIVASAARVCGADDVSLCVVDGDELRRAAGIGPFSRSLPEDLRFPLTRESVAGRAVVDRAALHVPDLAAESEEEFPVGRALQRRFGHRAMLAVPLLRDAASIGVIIAFRLEPGPFPAPQIALLRTFADQAVIAIENARLFNELEQRNRDVTEALEQQTATAEILRAISRSPTDVQPVFDTIAASATRLCGGLFGLVFRYDGAMLTVAAHHGSSPERVAIIRSAYPAPPGPTSVAARAILERRVISIADAQSESQPPQAAARARAIGYRSILSVPMLRNEAAIGAINVVRDQPVPFSEAQVELLKTFADQAVIAIENVRLFTELQARTGQLAQSVGELQALGEVSRAVGSSLDLDVVLDTIVARAVQLSRAAGGVIYEYDDDEGLLRLRGSYHMDEQLLDMIRAAPLRLGEGATGRAAALGAPVEVTDVLDEREYDVGRLRGVFERLGYRSLLAVPLLAERRIFGALGVWRQEPGSFAHEIVTLLQTFAAQSVLAIQNARLFRELADKSRQLEAASRHKSEFLANMSHELRTPLNAIIGFSEVLTERMFGELNDKQDEYLRDIHASGAHLLSLINDILDLSKIEAGRMELELTHFDLPEALANACTLVRERAGRRGIALHQRVDDALGRIRADERKIKQVVLNLLSNALKFTPEGGRVDVRGTVVDGMAQISVSDTGIGIAPEDQAAVFEEFRQVGTADAKAEGTGLGLALSRKFIELHRGRIWVESELGAGSTFVFTLPLATDE